MMVLLGARGGTGLLERDGELGLVAALVARVRGGEGAVLVVEGQAGVGKTELLRAAEEVGEAEGLRVLRARGSELDRAFAFGVVRQLLECCGGAGGSPPRPCLPRGVATVAVRRVCSRLCRGCIGWW